MKKMIALLAASAFLLPAQASASQEDCTKPSCAKVQETRKEANTTNKVSRRADRARASASQPVKETRDEMLVYPALFEATSRF